jgi:hypothetical protein
VLYAAEFAKFIGVARESLSGRSTTDTKFLASKEQSGDSVFQNGRSCLPGLLPELPRLFDLFGGDSWTVYRFLTQHHPELDGDTPLSALQRGKVNQVFGRGREYQ